MDEEGIARVSVDDIDPLVGELIERFTLRQVLL